MWKHFKFSNGESDINCNIRWKQSWCYQRRKCGRIYGKLPNCGWTAEGKIIFRVGVSQQILCVNHSRKCVLFFVISIFSLFYLRLFCLLFYQFLSPFVFFISLFMPISFFHPLPPPPCRPHLPCGVTVNSPVQIVHAHYVPSFILFSLDHHNSV